LEDAEESRPSVNASLGTRQQELATGVQQLQVLHAEYAPDINAFDKAVVLNTNGVIERNSTDLLVQAIGASLVEMQQDLAGCDQQVQHELQARRSSQLSARKPLEDADESRSSVDAPLGTVQQELPTCVQ